MVVSYSEQWLPHNEPRLVAQHQRDRGRHSGPARCRRMQKSPTTTAFMPQLIVVFFFLVFWTACQEESRRGPEACREERQRCREGHRRGSRRSVPSNHLLRPLDYLLSRFFLLLFFFSPFSLSCFHLLSQCCWTEEEMRRIVAVAKKK